MPEKPLFPPQSAAIAHQCALAADHAMARHNDREWVLPIGRTHCTDSLGLADRVGDVLVRGGAAKGDGQHRYELLGVHGPHIHLICRSCGKVKGIDLEEAQPLAEQLQVRYGFVADLDHLSISGLCRACAERAAEPL